MKTEDPSEAAPPQGGEHSPGFDLPELGERLVGDVIHRMERGFCVVELETRADGAADARCLYVNPAFERQTGLSDVAGRTWGEIVPNLEPHWLERVRAALRDGGPVAVTERVGMIGRWFEVELFRLGPEGSRRVGILFSDVTMRRQAEAELVRNETRFRVMADALPQIVWITDAEGSLDFYNQRWVEYIGHPAAPTNANEVADHHVHPDDRELTKKAFEKARAEGTVFEAEHRIRGRDGRYRWFLVRGEPYRDPVTGEVIGWFGSSTDIDDRKLAEEARARSEERLRLIVETARDYAIFLTDVDNTVTDWWPGAAAVFGWSHEEIVGRKATILYVPEDLAAGVPEAEIETARAEGSAPDIRWHLRKDGRRVFIEGSVIALRTDSGTLRGFLKIGRDSTEAQAAAAALRASEARFRDFSDASSDCLWIRSGEDLGFDHVSQSCRTVLGMDCAALLGPGGGELWARLVHEEDVEAVGAHLRRVAGGDRSVLEFRISRPFDGEPRWLQDTCFPLLDGSGAVSGVAGITKDVTLEKETRERLRVLVSELQHRTRNLLAVVQALAERTLVGSQSLDDFRLRFYPRLTALARVNELLSRLDVEDRVTFDQLVRAELSAHGALEAAEDGGRVSLSGPDGIRLRSSTIQTLALALHELCTNALKYGALAHPGARLDLRWSQVLHEDGARRLLFTWEESDLPSDVGAPEGGRARRGFGRELIERALPRQLKTEVEYTIGDGKVRCTISLPLSTVAPPV